MQKECRVLEWRSPLATLALIVLLLVAPVSLVQASSESGGNGIQHGGAALPEAVQMGIHEQSWASGSTRHKLLFFPAVVVVLTVVLVAVFRKRKP